MKRLKTPVGSATKQRSISSFFTSVSPGPRVEVPQDDAAKHLPKSGTSTCNSDRVHHSSAVSQGNIFSKQRKTHPSLDRDPSEVIQSKKRRREEFNSSISPEVIPATPPAAPSPSKGKKGNFLSLKKSCSGKEIDKTVPGNKFSPSKVNCSTFSNSKAPEIISPIRTEDDDILKSILEHISPHRSLSKSKTQKQDPCSLKRTLFPTCSTHVKKSDKLNVNELDSERFSSPKKDKGYVIKKSEDLNRLKDEELICSSSKLKSRRSSQSPIAPETPELKYPPLVVKTSISRPKAKVITPNSGEKPVSLPKQSLQLTSKSLHGNIESKSPLKQTLKTASKCSPQKNQLGCSPVRRSPRKLSLLCSPVKEKGSDKPTKDKTFLNVCEEPNTVGKENKAVSPVHPRRSPRKHVSSCVAGENIERGNSSNKDCHSIDLQAAFHDEHDDIMAYMASVHENEYCLDLSELQLCEVESIQVNISKKEAEMKVKGIKNHGVAYCTVRGCWLACPVSEGDSISLQAAKVGGDWLLDSTAGLLVLHPDTLISGTAVVGSLFCARRSVLSSYFQGMDSDSSIMVVGSIVHELFQMALKQRKQTETEIKKLSEQLITSNHCIRMLYGANMNMAQIQKEMLIFIPQIANFMEKFVVFWKDEPKSRKGTWLGAPAPVAKPHQNTMRRNQSDCWDGKIIAVHDIEEVLWEPKLGIKGMVDVSVEVRDTCGSTKVIPLELKTGRASFSAEHRGQVTLYTMMMSRMGQAVESGLLLYLREGKIQEISVSHNERKDLVHLRNTLAHFLKPRVPVMNEETHQFNPLKLPEPISFKSACEKCPYSTLCSVYLKRDGLSYLSSDHPMMSISSSMSQHLTDNHIDYVMHWVGLLLLEETDQSRAAKFRHIWRFSPEEREIGKQAIAYLSLLGPGEEKDNKFIHTFSRKETCNGELACDLRETGLSIGDFVLISTDKRVAVDHGSIVDIDTSSVKVSANRNLHDRHACDTFHLDTSVSNTALNFNLTNLGCLLDNTDSAERLRKIVIEKAVPKFSARVEKSIIQDCLPIFSRLNKDQRAALVKTLRSDSYLLIKGLPGTGKTATMVALVQLLARAGLSVIITSHTHSAVDNLLLRLKTAGLKFLRLGADSRIHPNLRSHSERTLTEHCQTPEDLDKIFSDQQIVGVTCLGAGHAAVSSRTFDICLVDESTQVLQPSVLRPLFNARRFILVGDPEQLPPVVKCHQAQELGLSESLFTRLDSETATVSLTLNYRMNQVITDLANRLTYEGKLKCGNEEVANACLKLNTDPIHDKLWLSSSLSMELDKSVVFVDTSGKSSKSKEANSIEEIDTGGESSCSNNFELAIVMQLLDAFMDAGVNAEEIGIMAPYRAQVSLLTQSIKSNSRLAGVEVNTVDQFQGRDKEVIVYSCTRSDGASHQKPKDREILNDKRRLTVAITRAKHKLILIGHSKTLKLYAPFQKLLSCLSKNDVLSVWQ